jgi:hypothetical protein
MRIDLPRMKTRDMKKNMKKASRVFRHIPKSVLAYTGVALTSLFVIWKIVKWRRHHAEIIVS